MNFVRRTKDWKCRQNYLDHFLQKRSQIWEKYHFLLDDEKFVITKPILTVAKIPQAIQLKYMRIYIHHTIENNNK